MFEAYKFRSTFIFHWEILNFSYCVQECEEYLCSPEFAVDPKRVNCWELLLFPRGNKESNSKTISLFLKSKSINKEFIKCFPVNYEISLLTSEKKIRRTKKFTTLDLKEHGLGIGWPHFVPRKKLFNELKSEVLSGDTLTIQCRFWTEPEQDLLLNLLCKARTTIEVDRVSFEWAVDDFSSKPQEKAKLILSNSRNLKTELNIESGCVLDDNVAIQISQLYVTQVNFATCHISHIKSTGETEISAQDDHFFAVEKGPQTWMFPSFLTRQYLVSNKDVNLPNDRLTLRCEYATSLGSKVNEKEYSAEIRYLVANYEFPFELEPKFPICENGLKSDIRVLYDEKTLSDVTLCAGSDNFPVHKLILSARSPVFKAMFTSDLKEKNSDFVNIEDLDGDTVKRMLLFIYKDNKYNTDMELEDYCKLYFASLKYDLPALKHFCLFCIKIKLNLSNVYEVLEFANMYQEEELKKYVQDLIFLNDEKILRSDDWESFGEKNASLALQTLNFVYKKKLDTLSQA